jgi:hypothetical protein
MNFLLRLSSRSWIIALLAAGCFLIGIDHARVGQVEYISGLAEPVTTVDAASPTGYAGGLRRLIVPEHNNASNQWIAQTQQMLARSEWRVRHVDYDNAPMGREVRTTSPYRWWLGLVAWCDHTWSGRPIGLAVERAALFADPILQLLLLAGAVIFTAQQFGTFPATLLALASTVTFPFAGAFLPGQPGDSGLIHLCALWSVLPLLVALRARQGAEPPDAGRTRVGPRTSSWFFAAGFAGGIGLWVNALRTIPILAGIFVGGMFVAWLARRDRPAESVRSEFAPWRAWALGGATTCLAGYVIEYFPAQMGGLRFETIHPLYGLVWLGAGEVLAQMAGRLQGRKLTGKTTQVAVLLLAAAAVTVILIRTGGRGIGADDTLATRLTSLPNSPMAPNIFASIYHDGFTAMALAAILPLLLLVPAMWLLAPRQTSAAYRRVIGLALGPVLVSLAFACFQLSWWSVLDSVLLALLVAVAAAIDSTPPFKINRWLWFAGTSLVLCPGAVLLVAAAQPAAVGAVADGDVIQLIERDLAYWLANQAGPEGAVVLAPPGLTTSLYFHGGLAGLGTPYWENKEGFAAAVRIAGATSPDEAQAVAQSRGLTYIVLPSWDPFLDEYARLGSRQADHSLTALLHQWQPPRWLRPVPHPLPKIAGFEGLSVVIFQVVDVQDNATALSRLAEYFVEMGQIDLASSVSQALENFFPADIGALVARTLVEQARGDGVRFAHSLDEVQTALSRGDDSALPWDRRVSLAIALTEGKRFDLAREQARRCMAELDGSRLRSLTTVSLYRLQVISKTFGLKITDQRLSTLARELLPVELRNNL